MTITIDEPTALTASTTALVNQNCTTPGSATVEGANGTSPYTYTWPSTAGSVSGNTASSLMAGTYEVTVADDHGCEVIETVTIIDDGDITASSVVNTELLCNGDNIGAIDVTITDGTADYTIDWGSGSTTISGTSYTITGLTAGTYDITVTDINGCQDITTTTLTEPDLLVISELSTSHIDVDCNGNATGELEVISTGGTTPYEYSLNGGTAQASGLFTGLTAGTYTIEVTDAHACTDDISITITEPEEIIVEEVVSDALCYGENGEAQISILSGGVPDFTIIWQDGTTTFENTNILVNTNFGYTVTDANGCTYSDYVEVNQPTEMIIQLTGNNVTCNGTATGNASVQVSGGTPTYVYEWSTGGITPQIINLVADEYWVTVKDFNGCETSGFITITEPEPLSLTGSTQPVVCGTSLGSAHVDVTGGTVSYNYIWSNEYEGNTATGLVSGNYTVSVTDNNGCSDEITMFVGVTGSGIVEITQTADIQCYGDSSGSLTGTMTNGIAPFEYIWSNEDTTQTINNLPAGIYSLEITDLWGCAGSNSYMLTQPDQLELSFTTTEVSCYGYTDGSATVIVSGGTPEYTYDWETNETTATLSDVGAGNYQVLVTDSHFCEAIGNVNVIEPESALTINLDIQNISCYGYTDGAVIVNVEGGTPEYSYNWQIEDYNTTEANINNLGEGIYYLTVTDSRNCVHETEAIIAEPSELNASFSKMDPSCIGNNNGYIEIIPEGGTAPYTYVWSEGTSGIEFIDGLVEGEYLVTVIDANGCEYELDIIQLTDIQEECLKIPNAFTPNADGINDTWILENIHLYPTAYIKVFNRWGQNMYEAKGIDEPWDGNYNGNPVPVGVYLYVIDLFNGDEPYTGTVTIVR